LIEQWKTADKQIAVQNNNLDYQENRNDSQFLNLEKENNSPFLNVDKENNSSFLNVDKENNSSFVILDKQNNYSEKCTCQFCPIHAHIQNKTGNN
jgi:hypothetical protein